ncbi:MAG: HAMP domain-containing histidine kinase [Coriobacteriales bacterium]|jgi:two-component system OmpR family sensor kinase|nr:HAMP domain-containing histidine kinase [Coriobacteriales bacterium]
MQYHRLRLLLSLICAVFSVGIALAFLVLFSFSLIVYQDGHYEGQYWIAIICIPLLAVLAFICAYIATGIYVGPLSKLSLKVKQLADGHFGTHFMDDKMNDAPLGVQELASALDTVGYNVRNAMAEAAAENKRQSQFVGDVAHEIRTPLTAIRGAAETMMDADISLEDRRHFGATIVRESKRLTRLANDLLTLQHIEGDGEIALHRIDLHVVVRNAADMLEPVLEEREANLEISGEAPDVLGDPDRLQQVVQNLIDNASRYVSKGGTIKVELSGVREHSVITVSDDGPGFGDVDPARLFDRFYRGDTSRARTTGGAGLGLTIVKAIVMAHDGTVEAFNLPNGGACFVVAIPSLPPQLEK